MPTLDIDVVLMVASLSTYHVPDTGAESVSDLEVQVVSSLHSKEEFLPVRGCALPSLVAWACVKMCFGVAWT